MLTREPRRRMATLTRSPGRPNEHQVAMGASHLLARRPLPGRHAPGERGRFEGLSRGSSLRAAQLGEQRQHFAGGLRHHRRSLEVFRVPRHQVVGADLKACRRLDAILEVAQG